MSSTTTEHEAAVSCAERALVQRLRAGEMDEEVEPAVREYRRTAQALVRSLRLLADNDVPAERIGQYLAAQLDREVGVLVGNAEGRRDFLQRAVDGNARSLVEQVRREQRQRERAEQWQQ